MKTKKNFELDRRAATACTTKDQPTRRDVLRGTAGVLALATFNTDLMPRVFGEQPSSAAATGHTVSFDADWRFFRGDPAGAEQPGYDDGAWRTLDVPHDWRIEDLPYATSDDGGASANPSLLLFQKKEDNAGVPVVIGPFDANADTKLDVDLTIPGVGPIQMLGGRSQGYTVGDIGWYRKHFRVEKTTGIDCYEVQFDGIYQNSDVWINGKHLGFHPNGYTSFAYDLTSHLLQGADNVIAVRVNNRGKTSRWYSGSGIYRHTWLTGTAGLRIPAWGLHITTPAVDAAASVVSVEAKIANKSLPQDASLRFSVFDASGKRLTSATSAVQQIPAGADATHSARLTVAKTSLWSPESPVLYRLLAEVLVHGRVIDSQSSTFGFRVFTVDGTKGLTLNGIPLKIQGANIHHDHGPIGTVALERAEIRKVELLKAAGFNSIRFAHNAPSPSILSACDRLGVLVYEEFTDMWETAKLPDDYHLHFAEWWQRDLTNMIVRDRNHPSVFLWSIGNEISDDAGNYAPKLAATVRSLDPTRPVVLGGQNLSAKIPNVWALVDIGDFHGAPPPAERKAHPDKAFLQSEDTSPEIYNDWKLAKENPWYIGSWVWSGWDYIGEAGGGAAVAARSAAEAGGAGFAAAIGRIPYPWYDNSMSDLDLIGQRKPQNFLRAVVTGRSPLEIMVERPTPPGTQQFNVWYSYFDELPSWTWDLPIGQAMSVHVYTTGDSVALMLNGQTLETKALTVADKCTATFSVPYKSGELTAVSSLSGQEIARKTLRTTGKPAAVRLTADVKTLTTGRDDLAHVLVEIVDAQGAVVPDAVVQVRFSLEGQGEIYGVANGNPHNVDSFKKPRHWTWHGQALAIVRPAKQPGKLTIGASATGLRGMQLTLPVLPYRELSGLS